MPKQARNDLTAEYVRSVINYDPETGIFTWRSRHDVPPEWNTRRAGDVAGATMLHGYRMLSFLDRKYLAHRIAWLHYYGEWPKDQIDHINMNRSDNRIVNLREANNSQNNSNRPAERCNKTGHKGVRFHKKSGLWHAQITVNGVTHSLKYHRTPEEAGEAYKRAAKELHGEFSRTEC